MKETTDERIKREEIEKRKKIEALRPMSRLEFQILYGKCASSGWVYGEFNETLYQQYLQRYGFFLCHLFYLKYKKTEADGLLTKLSKKSDLYFLIDTSRLIHTISLPGTTLFYKNLLKNNSGVIKWFFAESPNTLETYVYNPNRDSTPYYTGPLKILETETATGVGKKTVQEQNWINQNIILLDFFPFPIIMSTDIRKDVVEEGYTFRVHLSEYFKPLVKNVKKIFDAPALVAAPANVYLIAPPYTSVHAILELTDFEWAELVKLNASGTYKQSSEKPSFGFDTKKTPKKIYDGHLNIRENEFNEFKKNFNLKTSAYSLNNNIPSAKDKYPEFCAYLKNRIYLNDSRNPGIQDSSMPDSDD